MVNTEMAPDTMGLATQPSLNIQSDIETAMGVNTQQSDIDKAIDCIRKCDITTVNSVGLNVQKQISVSIQGITSKCKALECGEAGKALQELSCATDVDLGDTWVERTLMTTKGRFKRFITKYQAANEMLNTVVIKIEESKNGIEKSFEELATLIDTSKAAFVDLDPIIKAFKVCVKEQEEQVGLSDPSSLVHLRNTQELQVYRKRLETLEATQVVLYQTVRESMMLMITNKTLIDDMQYTVDNIVPLWQAQIITATNAEMQAKASHLNKQVHDAFNKMLIDNAKRINATADEILSTSSEGMLRTDTLEKVGAELDTLKNKLNEHYIQNVNQYASSISKIESLMEKRDNSGKRLV